MGSTKRTGTGVRLTRTKMPRLVRTSAMTSPPLVHRVGALQPFIVVVKHTYPMELASNSFGTPRGLGNTFTMEVVAADIQDATATVEAMFELDFGEADTLDIVSVEEYPRVDFRNGNGRTVSVLSSRHCPLHDGTGPYEEMFNAVRDDKTIAARQGAAGPMTNMETRLARAMTEAMRKSVAVVNMLADAITSAVVAP